MISASEQQWVFTVVYNALPTRINIDPYAPLSDLQGRLEDIFDVPAERQTLLMKGLNVGLKKVKEA